MHRLDRALGILLLLRSGTTVSATVLAERFEVSTRTIYRDLETLGALGVPLYAEQGRNGGYRLLDGYFLPPVMFTTGEATALLLGLTLLRALQGTPFVADLGTAEQKLLASLPDRLRDTLAHLPTIIGFEAIPDDLLHPEPDLLVPSATARVAISESEAMTIFLQARFADQLVTFTYLSPYRPQLETWRAIPAGLIWDRPLVPRRLPCLAGGAKRRTTIARLACGPRPQHRPDRGDERSASAFRDRPVAGAGVAAHGDGPLAHQRPRFHPTHRRAGAAPRP